ncbi:MAG: CvpA family protein [Chloroflexi bacterium]|nr:CvpA family protein [Chloroflexota bacterium]
MDVGAFLAGIRTVDLVLTLLFMAFFVLGFAQGTIRRLIGVGSVLFAFLFAANLAQPLGEFLGNNWTQFSRQYSYMVGFGTIFLVATLAFALLVQSFYQPQPLFEKARFADELIGGLLGLLQAFILLGAAVVILDSFFRLQGIAADPQELPFLRELWTALDASRFVAVFRADLIPAFFAVTGFLVPDTIEVLYRGTAA